MSRHPVPEQNTTRPETFAVSLGPFFCTSGSNSSASTCRNSAHDGAGSVTGSEDSDAPAAACSWPDTNDSVPALAAEPASPVAVRNHGDLSGCLVQCMKLR